MKIPCILRFPTSLLFVFGLFFISSNIAITNAQNDYSVTITIKGSISEVREPMFVCSNDNRIFDIWGESDDYKYGGSDVIYIQEIDHSGKALGEKTAVVTRSELHLSSRGLGCPKICVDSNNDLHIFWGIFNSNQDAGSIYYKKMDLEFNVLVDSKVVLSNPHTYSGRNVIRKIHVDQNDTFHLLTHNRYYLHLDNEGNNLNSYDTQAESVGDAVAMEVDSSGNVLIVFLESYDIINLLHLENKEGDIINASLTEVYENMDELVHNPRLTIFEDSFYLYWYLNHDQDGQVFCKEISYSGEIINTTEIAIANVDLRLFVTSYNFLSRNKTLVPTILINQFSCDLKDSVFNFTLHTFFNNTVVEEKKILTILRNPSYDHVPSVFGLKCIEDYNGNYWLTWYVNNGANGFQVMYWKLNSKGIPVCNVTTIAPELLVYEEIYSPVHYIWSFYSILVLMTFILVRKITSKKSNRMLLND